MNGRAGLPAPIRWLVHLLVPPSRRSDVLGDLEESVEARSERLGGRAARRHLWKEVAALPRWRLGLHRNRRRPLRITRTTTRSGYMGRDLLQDLTFGVRTLARRPAFAGTAVLILGLGIGAPTTVLTLVNRIFFDRPPEVTEPHRIFRAFRSWAPGEGGGSMQHPDYLYYRENASTLSGLAAYGGSTVGALSTGGSEPSQLRGVFVSDNYFDVLGVRPAQGRFFLLEENAEPAARPVMVLSDAFWKRALGGDPGVVGRSVLVNGITFTVVGVAPAAFRGLSPVEAAPDAWFPIAMFGALNRFPDAAWWERVPGVRSNWLTLVGRLAPGVTFDAAEANLAALSDALTYDGRNEQEGIIVVRDYLYRPSQAATLEILSTLLLAVVGLVLAIAAANVTVLLLSRATSRTAEMGIRTAMGAGRSRLFRQLLTESLLLGLAGGAVGIGLAYLFSDAAASLLPFPFITDFRPHGSVLGAAVGISVVASVLVGLAPALHASRTEVARTIQGVGAAARRSRLRAVLVVGQVALSLVLVSGALLFARSFNAARTFELGWEASDRLVVQVNLRGQGYSEEEGVAFIPRALERLAAVPGVGATTTSRMIPFQGDWSTNIEPPEGAMPNTEDGSVWIGMNVVHPGYFELMGIPVVRGQPLGSSARPEGPPAVVMNETLAETLFAGADPVGQILTLGGDRTFTVVGVARDAVYYELGEEPTTQLYGSVLQIYQPIVHFVLETGSDAASLAPAVQAALRELDPNLVFPFVTTLASVVDDQTARYRVSAVLVGVFSALALLLAVVGLYGVVSFVVAQRTPEIGVRMALGADRTRIAREVLQQALELAGAGLALGLIGVLLGRRVTSALLFGTVAADDPLPLVMGILVLAAAVSAASLIPARRATRVDPVDAIRSE